jgi:hypothetical protein
MLADGYWRTAISYEKVMMISTNFHAVPEVLAGRLSA